MAKRMRCWLGFHRLVKQVNDGDTYGECVCGKRSYTTWVSELPGDHDPAGWRAGLGGAYRDEKWGYHDDGRQG
jgi:hypothetical protein